MRSCVSGSAASKAAKRGITGIKAGRWRFFANNNALAAWLLVKMLVAQLLKVTGAKANFRSHDTMARIRTADAGDIARIVDMAAALIGHLRSPIVVDRDWTMRTVAQLIADPAGCVFVSDGGFIMGLLQPTLINPAPVARELGWWAGDGSGLHLLRAFEGWAKERGATLVQLSTAPEGPDLARIGYARAELAWVR